MPEDPRDPVRDAERLVREATERAEQLGAEIPPRGYESRAGAEGGTPPFPDLSALAGLMDLARSSLPPDLQRQLQQALRELLIALRAVLDYSIDRLEPGSELEVRHERRPMFLYPQLDERGFVHQTDEPEPGLVRILIRRGTA